MQASFNNVTNPTSVDTEYDIPPTKDTVEHEVNQSKTAPDQVEHVDSINKQKNDARTQESTDARKDIPRDTSDKKLYSAEFRRYPFHIDDATDLVNVLLWAKNEEDAKKQVTKKYYLQPGRGNNDWFIKDVTHMTKQQDSIVELSICGWIEERVHPDHSDSDSDSDSDS